MFLFFVKKKIVQKLFFSENIFLSRLHACMRTYALCGLWSQQNAVAAASAAAAAAAVIATAAATPATAYTVATNSDSCVIEAAAAADADAADILLLNVNNH